MAVTLWIVAFGGSQINDSLQHNTYIWEIRYFIQDGFYMILSVQISQTVQECLQWAFLEWAQLPFPW